MALIPSQSTQAWSFADVEAFDPRAARGGSERVSRCPICQSTERAFHFNSETGAYNCKRASCGAKGKLSDFWTDRPKQNRRARVRMALARAFELPPEPETQSAPATAYDETWREGLQHLMPLRSTPGASYLESRGIPADLAHENNVRFTSAWAPRRAETNPYRAPAAVLFPMADRSGQLVAINGRYIRAGYTPKTRIGGAASSGAFATFGAFTSRVVTLCEGPFDALSLQVCGFASVAMIGCALPEWLPEVLAFKRVLIASDADEAGDKAAADWIEKLQAVGCRCARLKPYQAKDWNEMHERAGTRKIAAYLSARLAHIRHFEWLEK